jgi:hypothetical protein
MDHPPSRALDAGAWRVRISSWRCARAVLITGTDSYLYAGVLDLFTWVRGAARLSGAIIHRDLTLNVLISVQTEADVKIIDGSGQSSGSGCRENHVH